MKFNVMKYYMSDKNAPISPTTELKSKHDTPSLHPDAIPSCVQSMLCEWGGTLPKLGMSAFASASKEHDCSRSEKSDFQ